MTKEKRNWRDYNKKLCKSASIELYIKEDFAEHWFYKGKHERGGKIIYSDEAIELCLLVREYYKLPLRQTQGFIGSIIRRLNYGIVQVPNYTTLSRRCKNLLIDFKIRKTQIDKTKPLILAIDSTGLTVYSSTQWLAEKHGSRRRSSRDKWRKLHIVIDIDTGDVLSASYTHADINDSMTVPNLLADIDDDISISAVHADMAYDTIKVREAIYKKGAKQLIPPKRSAKLSYCRRKKIPQHIHPILQERDRAIEFIKENTLGDGVDKARKLWKLQNNYHRRSLVETAMSRIKAHTSDRLTNRNELNRQTQALLKVKIINILNNLT
jgi:transposase